MGKFREQSLFSIRLFKRTGAYIYTTTNTQAFQMPSSMISEGDIDEFNDFFKKGGIAFNSIPDILGKKYDHGSIGTITDLVVRILQYLNLCIL